VNESKQTCCTLWGVGKTVAQRLLLAFGTALFVGGICQGLHFGKPGGACALGAAIIVLFAPGLSRRRPAPAGA